MTRYEACLGVSGIKNLSAMTETYSRWHLFDRHLPAAMTGWKWQTAYLILENISQDAVGVVGGSPIEVAGDKVLARPWQIDASVGS
jgi:hypothetical protein